MKFNQIKKSGRLIRQKKEGGRVQVLKFYDPGPTGDGKSWWQNPDLRAWENGTLISGSAFASFIVDGAGESEEWEEVDICPECGAELSSTSQEYPGKYEGELLHPCPYWSGLCRGNMGCCKCSPKDADVEETRERSAGCAYLL